MEGKGSAEATGEVRRLDVAQGGARHEGVEGIERRVRRGMEGAQREDATHNAKDRA